LVQKDMKMKIRVKISPLKSETRVKSKIPFC